jgi:hypothetical protein
MIRNGRAQTGITRALTVKVGSHGQDNDRPTLSDVCCVQHIVDQLAPSCLFIAQSENLFELIDQDEESMRFWRIMEGKTRREMKASLLVLRPTDKRRKCNKVGRNLLIKESLSSTTTRCFVNVSLSLLIKSWIWRHVEKRKILNKQSSLFATHPRIW